jgi:hypothetical protein
LDHQADILHDYSAVILAKWIQEIGSVKLQKNRPTAARAIL